MDVKTFEKKIVLLRQILLISTGATFTMMVMTIITTSDPLSFISTLFWIWVIIMITNTIPGFLLMLGTEWREFPLSRRLNLAFNFIGLAWLTLLTFVIGTTSEPSPSSITYTSTFCLGIFIALLYFWMRGKTNDPEEIFP